MTDTSFVKRSQTQAPACFGSISFIGGSSPSTGLTSVVGAEGGSTVGAGGGVFAFTGSGAKFAPPISIISGISSRLPSLSGLQYSRSEQSIRANLILVRRRNRCKFVSRPYETFENDVYNFKNAQLSQIRRRSVSSAG